MSRPVVMPKQTSPRRRKRVESGGQQSFSQKTPPLPGGSGTPNSSEAEGERVPVRAKGETLGLRTDRALAAFKDPAWQLWRVPAKEQKAAFQYELGREVMGPFQDNLNLALPAVLASTIADNGGRTWLELSLEERQYITAGLGREQECCSEVEAFAKGDLRNPAALLVPEHASRDEIRAMRDFARPLVASLWTQGSVLMLGSETRAFRLGVDFTKSLPSIMSDIEAALRDFARRAAISILERARGMKGREIQSSLMKLGLMRFKRQVKGPEKLGDTVLLWNKSAPEGWQLNGGNEAGYKQMRDAGYHVRKILKQTFPESAPPE